MIIKSIRIKNYKSIRELEVKDIENTCILVGKNNTGKTVVLDAILTAMGQKAIKPKHFTQANCNIEIGVKLSISDADMKYLWRKGKVSRFKKFDLFLKDFFGKFPSFTESEATEEYGILEYTFVANRNGQIRYNDGYKKNNPNIEKILPKIYYIDHRRDIAEIERDILESGMYESENNEEGNGVRRLRENKCMFDEGKTCNACFQCIGKIMKKNSGELTVFETEKLLEYKLLHADNENFMERLNACFKKNSGMGGSLVCRPSVDIPGVFNVEIVRYREGSDVSESIFDMSEGFKSIYILSLLETYMQQTTKLPCILMIEDPELFLHPQMQKTASEILYRLSKKNQVIFSTHAPSMLYNFNSRQIKQLQLDRNGSAFVSERVNISRILDDLGYSAGDLMDVSFVFIVEGKQDKQRLPLLLERFYNEVYDEKDGLNRVAIISTNSCTNIKTYANLKYINQIYLKDQFLMIRDGDGKDADELRDDLCSYYKKRRNEDLGDIPRVTPQNVLILKYYSLENYFLNPSIMAKVGIIADEDEFYRILFEKYNEYLYRLSSFEKLRRMTGVEIKSIEDVRKNLELIKIHGRGHNLYDIFYGKYRGAAETKVLRDYIAMADRTEFEDILNAIDSFVFFNSRKK